MHSLNLDDSSHCLSVWPASSPWGEAAGSGAGGSEGFGFGDSAPFDAFLAMSEPPPPPQSTPRRAPRQPSGDSDEGPMSVVIKSVPRHHCSWTVSSFIITIYIIFLEIKCGLVILSYIVRGILCSDFLKFKVKSVKPKSLELVSSLLGTYLPRTKAIIYQGWHWQRLFKICCLQTCGRGSGGGVSQGRLPRAGAGTATCCRKRCRLHGHLPQVQPLRPRGRGRG